MQNTKEYNQLFNLCKEENESILNQCQDFTHFKKNLKIIKQNIIKFKNNIDSIILEIEENIDLNKKDLFKLNKDLEKEKKEEKNIFSFFLKRRIIKKMKILEGKIYELNIDLTHFKTHLKSDVDFFYLEIEKKSTLIEV